MYKLYTSSYVYCYLVFYALESAVRPLGERRYTKQPLLLLLLLLRTRPILPSSIGRVGLFNASLCQPIKLFF